MRVGVGWVRVGIGEVLGGRVGGWVASWLADCLAGWLACLLAGFRSGVLVLWSGSGVGGIGRRPLNPPRGPCPKGVLGHQGCNSLIFTFEFHLIFNIDFHY